MSSHKPQNHVIQLILNCINVKLLNVTFLREVVIAYNLNHMTNSKKCGKATVITTKYIVEPETSF